MGTFYDREIEYLESTGTQWINTGIITDTVHWSLKAQVTIPDTSGNSVLISTLANGGQFFGDIKSAGNMWGAGGTTGAFTSVSSTTLSTIELDYTSSGISGKVNGVSFSRTGTPATGVSYTLFGSHYPSFPNFDFGISAKLYYARCTIDGVLVRDFIPVRVGQTGYLFDRVSCQLFGNAGTGNFVLGDDMYDARVEYVGITGTSAGFDIGYVPNGTDIIIDTNIRFKSWGGSSSNIFYNSTSANTEPSYIIRRNGWANNALMIGCGQAKRADKSQTYTLVANTLYNFRLKFGQVAINHVTYTLNKTASSTENTSQLYIGKSGNKQDVYYFKIYKADVLVVDLIPVRKGQVAYLYDRITNQLFGKSGTGDLLLGNDIQEIPYEAEIEYLQGDGYAYLSLMSIKELSPDVANWSIDWMKRVSGIHVFGGMNTDSMQLVSNYNTFRFDWCKSSSPEAVSINANTRYSLVQEDGYLKINNVSKQCTKNITQNTRFFLFTKNPREAGSHFKGNIYGMKVWSRSTGEILYDYIPVRIKDVGYFYDKINGTLHGNIGSGSFVLGPDKPMSYDAEVDYITFDGTQSINTGIYGDLNTDLIMTCRKTSSGNLSILGSRATDGTKALTAFTSGIFVYVDCYDNTTSRLTKAEQSFSWIEYRINKNIRQVSCLNKTMYASQTTQISIEFRTPNQLKVGGFEAVLSVAYANFIGQMGPIQIRQNDVLVRDYIPVRKYGKGYLYDKVTQKMFGNEFSSEFEIGPDKIKPIPISPSTGTVRYYSRRAILILNEKPPVGYAWVDHITNTANAYINTGIQARYILTIECESKMNTAASSYGSYLLNANNALQIMILSNGRFSVKRNNVVSYDYNNNKWGSRAKIRLTRGKCTIGATTKNINNAAITATDVLIILNSNTNGNTSTPYKGDLWYFKIYDNFGCLLRDYVPVIRLSDNKYGLWDKVSGTFNVSPNNVDFSGGEIIN